MPICGIYGCANRPGIVKNLSFYKVPKVITDQGEATKSLSEEGGDFGRLQLTGKIFNPKKNGSVCSNHFVGGKKAYLHDKSNPDWLPTLHLGTLAKTPGSDDKKIRYNRLSLRKEKKRVHVSEAVSSLLSFKKRRIDFSLSEVSADTQVDCNAEVDNNGQDKVNEGGDILVNAKDIDNGPKECGTQTDLLTVNIVQLESDLQSRIREKEKVCLNTGYLYRFSYYENHLDMVSFYTGLPDIDTLKLVYKFVEGYLPNDEKKCLSKEATFFICIIKLRMNYLFGDMANHLNVSISTIQRCFHETLDVLYCRLKFLIRWPKREALRTSMPMSFRENFGQKVVVILDCFELFTERPSGAMNKVYTYSNYKHHQTVKYLIGIAPQGVVTFISDGWGGRTSDKYITEKSEILDNLLPGDIVMVDRGFNIEESVNFYQAELAIPSFTRGKKQLHPVDVERTRKIASVRIHVERVIGHILRKFHIFEGIIPVEFIKLRSRETVPTIDKIVFAACALTNLCPSIVPFE